MMPEIRHHLDCATLMAYSAGTLGEALAAVAAAHIGLCKSCRDDLRDLDLLGGAMLDGLGRSGSAGREPMSPPAFDNIVTLPTATAVRQGAAAELAGPAAVVRRLGVDLDAVAWRRLAPGIWHYPLSLSASTAGDLRLIRIAPGKRMPEHGHGGTELTLVIEGCYRDETGEYRRGDIQDIDGESEHQPYSDADTGCICLIASERPARFKGLIPRLLQPLTGL